MPRGGMCETQNVPAYHAERVYDTGFVAANRQRSISAWNETLRWKLAATHFASLTRSE
jgi:hypothetical protein